MYITGIGKTKFGILRQGLPELCYEAMQKALKDANASIEDIEAIFVSNFLAGSAQSQLHINSLIASLLPGIDIPIIRIETACASSGAALHQAIISLSKYKNVMVLGAEKMSGVGMKEMTSCIAEAGDRMLDQKEGVIFPASYALIAQQHMLRYGTTVDDLALISLKAHKNANLNELAHFAYKTVTRDMINNSPIVSTPLRLFDCSPISDGAAALIISREKKDGRSIKILASALRTGTISLAQRKDITSFPAAKAAAEEAYAQAGMTPDKIDIAEVHDCFTIAELVAIEDLGFCALGESKGWIRQGKTSLTGQLPINTGGGLKANGHPIGATGASQVCEIVTQLRREAGARQVKKADIGLTHNVGGVGGTVAVHIFRRE